MANKNTKVGDGMETANYVPVTDDHLQKQKEHDNKLTEYMRQSLAKDLKDNSDESDDVAQKGNQQTVDNNSNNNKINDNTSGNVQQTADDTSSGDEEVTFDDVVNYIVDERYDGDKGKLDEAKAVANLALKTFGNDSINAAKSYYHLSQTKRQLDNFLDGAKKNPILGQMLDDYGKGTDIDETYIRNLTQGPAQDSGRQPQDRSDSRQLATQDRKTNESNFRNVTAEELISSGYLDKPKYDQASNLDRREMFLDAKMAYLDEKLPEHMLSRFERQQQERQKQQMLKDAETENKRRMDQSYATALRKYDNLDFENNPVHRDLLKEVQRVAYYRADPDDPNGLLIEEDAFEQALNKVFSKNGVKLQPVQALDTTSQNTSQTTNQGSGYDRAKVQKALQNAGVSLTNVQSRSADPNQQRKTQTPKNFTDDVHQRSLSRIKDRNEKSRMMNQQRQLDRNRA